MKSMGRGTTNGMTRTCSCQEIQRSKEVKKLEGEALLVQACHDRARQCNSFGL